MSRNKPVAVVPLVVDEDASTSPPLTPWQSAWKRFLSGLAVALPFILTFIVDPMVLLLSQQQVSLPDEWKTLQPFVALLLSGGVLVYQSVRKQQKESVRLGHAQRLGLANRDGTPTTRARNITASLMQ